MRTLWLKMYFVYRHTVRSNDYSIRSMVYAVRTAAQIY